MGYSAKAIANYFIEQFGKQNAISPLKIQKLVFISHGWHLALYEQPLVSDESAEAWRYGPVFPSLYHEFKEFGNEPISRLAKKIKIIKTDNNSDFSMSRLLKSKFQTEIPKVKKSDKQVCSLLDRVWEVYGNYSGLTLSELTHCPHSPWEQTREKFPNIRNANISDDLIQQHYSEKREKNVDQYD